MAYRLDIDESAIYDGERRVLELDTGGGIENYSNDNWRAANALGARIVELLNTQPTSIQRYELEIRDGPDLLPASNGDWVRWEDVQHLLPNIQS